MTTEVVGRLRRGLTTEAGAPDLRQRQYATLSIAAVLVGTIVAMVFQVTTPALIIGLTAVLALVGAGGQALRSDLHRFAWFGPALVLVMAVGPLLFQVPLLATAMVALAIFGTGMLPALGEHYRVVGQTLAAATLVSATTGIGADQSVLDLFGCAATGAVFALILRVLIGVGDPTKATRYGVARTLVEPGPGVVELAATAWRGDGSSAWLGQVLAGSARFRAAREALLAQAQRVGPVRAERLRRVVAEADRAAAELATAVRSRVCTGLPAAARLDPTRSVPNPEELPEAARSLNQGLDQVRAAVVRRDETRGSRPDPGRRREWARGAVQAHLTLRSSLFRHSLRCALAVAIGMGIMFLMGDPSASSLLLALCVVLQPAARDSMTGALERTGASVLGVVLLAAVITLLPGAYLLVPAIMIVMLLNIERVRTDYQFLLGSLIAVTVVDQAMRLDRELVDVAISFASNTAVGTAIALIVGYISYVVLPSSMLPDVNGAIRSTVWAVTELLRSVRATGRGAELRKGLHSAHVLALRRTQDLLGIPPLLDGTTLDEGDPNAARAAAVALDALRQDVSTLAFRPEAERALAVPALHAVDDLLGGSTTTTIPVMPPGSAPATEMLASSLVENGLHARAAIDQTLGYTDPWKSYTISFVRPERLRIR